MQSWKRRRKQRTMELQSNTSIQHISGLSEKYDKYGSYPQPSSHVTGRLGLCSQSLRCDCSWSSRRVAVQPKPALSQEICSLESMLRMIRGTGRRWARVTTVRSTGQICCCANHCVMQALQKACSQCGAWENRQIDQSVTWTQCLLTFLAEVHFSDILHCVIVMMFKKKQRKKKREEKKQNKSTGKGSNLYKKMNKITLPITTIIEY